MYTLARLLVFFLITVLAHAQDEGATIALKIENIATDDGHIRVGLYASEATWLKKPKIGTLGQIAKGRSEVTFTNIPDGTYAISVFHDADNDGELDSFFGIPTEDTGSSNDAPAKFGPPKWEDAKFEVQGGLLKQIITL